MYAERHLGGSYQQDAVKERAGRDEKPSPGNNDMAFHLPSAAALAAFSAMVGVFIGRVVSSGK